MSSCLLDLTKEGFIKRLNEQAGTDIYHTQIALSGDPITSVDGTADADNMTVTITPSVGSEYKGSKEVTIKAFQPTILAAMFGGKVPALTSDTSDIILKRVDDFYGIRFDVDTPATIWWNDTHTDGTLTISSHWAVTMPMHIKLKPMLPTLQSLMDVTALGKPHHNMGTTGEEFIDKTTWTQASYTWDVDFTPCKDMLLNYTAGSVWQSADAGEIAKQYLSVSRASSTLLSNIGGTTVIAAGKVADAPAEIKPALNAKFTNYIITPGITSASDKTQAYFIYIHFNA